MRSKIVLLCNGLCMCDKLKTVLLFIIVFGFFNVSNAQKCASPNITTSQFEYGYTFDHELSLNFSGVIESFLMTGTERIFDTTNNNWMINYIDARFARGVLEVYTTTNFRKYVEEQNSTRITLQVTLVCEDQSRPILVFRINIKRENLYVPTFSKSFYDFKIPLPLYQGFDLTAFEQVAARDIDIFDNRVTFSTNYSGLVAVKNKPDASSDGKTFYAMLVLTAPLIMLRNPLDFFITAMDNGLPRRSSFARIRITADESSTFFPPPRFEKNLYIGKLDEAFSLNMESLVQTFETWTTDVVFTKEGDPENLFIITPSNNRIQISLTRALTEADIEDRSFFGFAIVARRSDEMSGSCSVVIEIPQKSTEHRFSKPHYTGSLSKLGNLSVEAILYDLNDYSPDISFSVIGPDAYLFQTSNKDVNIQLEFIGDIRGINFQDRRYLFLVLTAMRDGISIANSAVTIMLPIVPKFEKTVYYGQISTAGGLTIETIHFEANVVSDIKSVLIRGNNSERFAIKGSREVMQLELIVRYSEKEIRILNYVRLIIVAISRADVEGTAEIIIEFPGAVEAPVFEQAIYNGRVTKDSTLVLADIVLRNDTYTDIVEYQLVGDAAAYFNTNITRNMVQLQTVQSFSPSFLQSQKYLHLILSARSRDNDSASTVILLDMPKFIGPEFTKIFYKGTLNRYFQLTIEDVSIKIDTFEDGTTVSLSGKDAKFFKVKMNRVNVLIEMNNEALDLDELSRRTSLDFTLMAQNLDGLEGKATISVEGPGSCDSVNSTCPPCTSTPSDTCVQTTTPDPTSTPIFDRKLYLYRIGPFYTGVIGTLSATIPGSTEAVLYSLVTNNNHLKARLSLQQTTGRLAAHDYVSPGLYALQAVAMNPRTNAKAYARVRISVDVATSCPNGTTVVSSALLVKHVAEERVYTDLFNAKYGQCIFSVFSMEPNDKGYVLIDNRTNLLTTIAIDREHPTFEGMMIPQILVQLKLSCPTSNASRQRRSSPNAYRDSDEPRSLVLTDDIPFNPLMTTISLIIDDINDHSPKFVVPPKDGFVVGYPDVEIYYQLMPEYLIKVEATDQDSGYNAKIRYSLDENDYFEIDPVSGVVFPLAKSSSRVESTQLTITASDRDGASDGRRTKLKIVVNHLRANHLTLLTINDCTVQDLEGVLKNMSQNLGGDIYSVRYSMLPSQREEKDAHEIYSRAKDRKTMLRTWIYVVDARGKFIEGNSVEKKFEALHNKYNFETSSYNLYREHDELMADTTGLIAGISVLGALLFAALAAAFVFWWFWIRPQSFKAISNETTSETISSEGSVDHEMKYKTNNSFYYEDGDAYDRANQLRKRDGLPIAPANNVDESDESNTNSLEGFSNSSENSDSSHGERRKSIVTFNELVERIDIEVNDGSFKHPVSATNDGVRL